jgi:Bacterial protein of unknown function (DUF885)
LSYYLGILAVKEARTKAESAQGERFDIRAFHDTILDMGTVSLPLIHSRIDRFISEGGKGPEKSRENTPVSETGGCEAKTP